MATREFKKRVLSIADSIIRDSFPDLTGKNIRIIVMRFRFYAFSIWIPPFIRIIVISKRTKDFNDFILTGIMAHELCHQERYMEMGFSGYLKFAAGFIFSGNIQTAEERATDLLTIKKGYGRQLYEVSKVQVADKNHEKINKNYLTSEEIKSYSESLGKW